MLIGVAQILFQFIGEQGIVAILDPMIVISWILENSLVCRLAKTVHAFPRRGTVPLPLPRLPLLEHVVVIALHVNGSQLLLLILSRL